MDHAIIINVKHSNELKHNYVLLKCTKYKEIV